MACPYRTVCTANVLSESSESTSECGGYTHGTAGPYDSGLLFTKPGYLANEVLAREASRFSTGPDPPEMSPKLLSGDR